MKIIALVVLLGAISSDLAAQEPSRTVFARIGAGLGRADGIGPAFTPTRHQFGAILSGQFGVGGRRVQAVAEFHWHPTLIRYEGGPDNLRWWYLMLGPQVYADQHIYFRPALGLAWSGGPDRTTESRAAVGLTIGGEWRLAGDRWLGLEAIFRRNSCLGDCGLSSGFLGVQLVVPFYRGG